MKQALHPQILARCLHCANPTSRRKAVAAPAAPALCAAGRKAMLKEISYG
jgi:hypothetical protein